MSAQRKLINGKDPADCSAIELQGAYYRLRDINAALLEECYAALPFLEDMREDPCYKSGTVNARIKSLLATIAKATQP